jgi:hypothetical protein
MEAETAKLQNALNKIANIHVQKYARIIRNNAITKARIGYVPAGALAAQQQAEQQAAVSASVATQTPVNQATQTAERSAVNAVNNAKYMNVPVSGSPNGKTTTLVKNGPNKPWRFRNQVPYYLEGANSNIPKVYLTYGQRPRNKFLGFM